MRVQTTFQLEVCLDSLFLFHAKCPANAGGWPETIEASANSTHLIPAYNADAQRSEDTYSLHDIIPEPEWTALDSLLPKLKDVADDRTKVRLLPNAPIDQLR